MKSPGEISRGAAAEMLNVSKATVSNWIRSGILCGDKRLEIDDVYRILKSIGDGSLNRLGKRANKKHSLKSVSATERKTAGDISRTGSFYTPDHIVDDILKDYKIGPGSSVCDPCCGNGIFLHRVSLRFGSGIILYGTDIDPVALAKAYESIELSKTFIRLSCQNSLFEDENGKHDFIFTNPPWGAHFSGEEKMKLSILYPEAASGDSLEYFLLKGYRSLKTGGVMSYILPESYLNVDRFRYSRKFFLQNSAILRIKNYGKIFKGVFTGVVRIDIQKRSPLPEHRIMLNDVSVTNQTEFSSEPSFRFNIRYCSEAERDFIRSMYKKPFTTLKAGSDWCLGIVTGNNSEFVSTKKSEKYPFPLVTGKNLSPYSISGNLSYLKDDFSKMQQVPKNDLFQKEKLFYKFISKKPVFSYDNTGLYSLNSANILIPRLENYTVKAVMAILNSKLISYFYSKEIGGLKILRSSLEQIPFPSCPDGKIVLRLDRLADKLIKGYKDGQIILGEIDELVNKLYGVKL